MSKSIYPEDFFNISHPLTPAVQIQFRIGEGKDDWEDINFNPNNFFNSLSIEDEGKIKKLELSLVDKNHSFLEDKIIRMNQTMLALSKKGNKELKDDFLQSFSSPSSSIRIRFGYSGLNENSFNTSSYEEFKKRIDEVLPVVKTPWLYFTVTGISLGVTENGLSADIQGFGELYPFLNVVKLSSKRSYIREEPVKLIKTLEKILNKTMEENIEVKIQDEPLGYINDKETYEIDLPLVKIKEDSLSFYKMSEILDNFCDLVSPTLFDKEGNPLDPKDYKEAENSSKKEHISYKYNWLVEDNDETKKIVFYYRHPNKSGGQKNIRTYTWLEHPQSVIKELNLSSDMMFSQLNLPVLITSNTGNHQMVNISEEGDGYTAKNLSELLDDENFSFTFTKKEYELEEHQITGGGQDNPLGKIITSASANLKDVLYQGSITFQGDPFYLFDEKLVPYIYKIQVIVKKPTYIDENGERIGGGKSYLSGEYIIKKIHHDISAGEFTTKLDIQRAI